MSRIALVTGGTRGIGAEISRQLKAAGRRVVASYAGNDEAARAFEAETGIVAKKFDAGDFAACQAAVAFSLPSPSLLTAWRSASGCVSVAADRLVAKRRPRRAGIFMRWTMLVTKNARRQETVSVHVRLAPLRCHS